MANLLENVVSVVIAAAALTIGVVEIHREFAPAPALAGGARPSEYVPEWRSMLPTAHVIGDASAPVFIVEFTDFECPYCRRFNAVLDTLRKRYPGAIATALIHFPLPMHPQAEAAARAVECASADGRLAQAVEFVFAQQDSLGKRPWSWFAQGAGIADTTRFEGCMADSAATRLVRAGVALGSKAGIHATPSIILNGWHYGMPPSDSELSRAVADLLAGRRPYKQFPASAVPALRARAE